MGSNRNGPLSGSWARLKTFAVPEDVGDTNAEGSSEAFARADHVHAHGDLVAGTNHPLARRDMEDDASHTDGFQSSYYDLRHRRLSQMMVDYGATTITSTHMPVPAFVASTLTTRTAARGDFIQLDTTAASGNVASVLPAAYIERRMEPDFAMRVRTGNLTSARQWLGLWDTTPAAVAPAGVSGAGIEIAAFVYDDATNVSGNWDIITCDGTSQTFTDSGVAVANATNYAFEIQCDDLATDAVRFYINGALVATVTATLPVAATALQWGATVTNLAATSRNFRIGPVTLTKAG